MQLLAVLASFAGSTYAFADTAPLFATPAFRSADFPYIAQSSNVCRAVKEYTQQFCSESSQPLFIYRVSSLDWQKLPLGGDSSFIHHVHYNSGSDVDLEVHRSCVVEYKDQIPVDITVSSANVIVVDLDGIDYQLDLLLAHPNVVVQGKPKFATVGSRADSIKEFLDDKLHLDLDSLNKIAHLSDSDDKGIIGEESYDLEDEYLVAEELLLANKKEIKSSSASDGISEHGSEEQKKLNLNLFTEYQFFTPGVWLSIIVSLFLVFVTTTAISWITSIELSYKSFEKQVDHEKKNE